MSTNGVANLMNRLILDKAARGASVPSEIMQSAGRAEPARSTFDCQNRADAPRSAGSESGQF